MTGVSAERALTSRSSARLPLDRLLDEGDAGAQARQARLGVHPPPEREHALDVVVLLVAVEAAAVAAGDAVEHAGDPRQPLDVGLDVAGDLELEPALAVGGDHLLERLRQAVADALGRVGGGDRVDQADGVAGGDRRRRLQAGEEGGGSRSRPGRGRGRWDRGRRGCAARPRGTAGRGRGRDRRAAPGRAGPGRRGRPGRSGRARGPARSAPGSGGRNGRRRCRRGRRGRARGRCRARRAAARSCLRC